MGMNWRKIDTRTLGLLIAATLVGAAWAYYNYASTGGARGENQLRPLVWTIFSTPFVLFIGWSLTRRAEVWLAAFVCFCLYFFTPFVAARTELFFMTQEQAQHSSHHLYFSLVMAFHVLEGLAVSVWRAMAGTYAVPEQAGQQTEPQAGQQAQERTGNNLTYERNGTEKR